MTSPKHLWSGDWQDESAAAAARGRGAPLEPPETEPVARRQPPVQPSDPEPSARPRATKPRPIPARRRRSAPPRPRRPPLRVSRMDVRRWAVTAGLAFVAAFVVATAVALIAHSSDSSSTSSTESHAPLSPARQGRAGAPGGITPSAPGTSPGWLGVQTESWPTGGALIDTVVPGSPADAAGLQPGDLIVGINNETVSSPDDVTRALDGSAPRQAVPIRVQRGPVSVTVQVTLVARPSGYATP